MKRQARSTKIRHNSSFATMNANGTLRLFTGLGLALAMSIAGCDEPTEDDFLTNEELVDSDPTMEAQVLDENASNHDVEMTDLELMADRVNEYVRAVQGQDVEAFEDMLSDEALEHTYERGYTIEGLVIKQSRALASTFDLDDGEVLVFEVEEIVEEGDEIRVYLLLNGEPVPKPMYFVRAGDELKNNIAPIGFSQGAPNERRGTNWYSVRNLDWQYPGHIACYSNWAWEVIGAGATGSISCRDACGWWDGGLFTTGGGNYAYCDYNSWGIDVYIDRGALGCNDYC